MDWLEKVKRNKQNICDFTWKMDIVHHQNTDLNPFINNLNKSLSNQNEENLTSIKLPVTRWSIKQNKQ